MTLEVRAGSIYNPGWEVVEWVNETLARVLATFTDKKDADGFVEMLESPLQ